ncbi:hypothetical protein ARMGADRAFT_556350 [Armillaria gallica]|uniref:Uncharacterized protein n=1 Tax=Armillaria gallica TaxID=47427 RepID=A0A2H3DB50_ARMGA|nr:hypothetical protein ARMGADRAFT_556350 [Armillaria gallica]
MESTTIRQGLLVTGGAVCQRYSKKYLLCARVERDTTWIIVVARMMYCSTLPSSIGSWIDDGHWTRWEANRGNVSIRSHLSLADCIPFFSRSLPIPVSKHLYSVIFCLTVCRLLLIPLIPLKISFFLGRVLYG